MGQPHKHAAVIKAWADGAEVQYRFTSDDPWTLLREPMLWSIDNEYRVAPKNVVVPRRVSFNHKIQVTNTFVSSDPNIEYTFDPNGKLLDAKVLKW